jgi:hypothetical protein
MRAAGEPEALSSTDLISFSTLEPQGVHWGIIRESPKRTTHRKNPS